MANVVRAGKRTQNGTAVNVPDFQALHKKEQERLANAKRKRPPTQFQEFKLTQSTKKRRVAPDEVAADPAAPAASKTPIAHRTRAREHAKGNAVSQKKAPPKSPGPAPVFYSEKGPITPRSVRTKPEPFQLSQSNRGQFGATTPYRLEDHPPRADPAAATPAVALSQTQPIPAIKGILKKPQAAPHENAPAAAREAKGVAFPDDGFVSDPNSMNEIMSGRKKPLERPDRASVHGGAMRVKKTPLAARPHNRLTQGGATPKPAKQADFKEAANYGKALRKIADATERDYSYSAYASGGALLTEEQAKAKLMSFLKDIGATPKPSKPLPPVAEDEDAEMDGVTQKLNFDGNSPAGAKPKAKGTKRRAAKIDKENAYPAAAVA